MKRTIALILALMMLCAPACASPRLSLETGETEEPATTASPTAATAEEPLPPGDTSGFCAGLGRADITPETSVPLAGYGNVEFRMSDHILDRLYATCVAVRDEDGETLLLFHLDIINTNKTFADQIKKIASEATGVPTDHMMTNCTHTHSAPAVTSSDYGIAQWKIKFYQAIRSAAADAVADLDACTIQVGKVETDRLNFVRRYYMENGFTSDHGTYGTGEIVAHESENDPEMRLIRFVRENRKDIVLANWQCHPHRTGGSAKYDVSADTIGAWRKFAERDGDLLFAYFQGGAGNQNHTSRISGEARYSDYRDIGRALCEHMREGLANGMSEMPAGRIRVIHDSITAPYDHEDEDKLAQCQEIYNVYLTNDRAGALQLCAKYGISSYFEAGAIITGSKRGESGEIPLSCYAIGDIGIAAAPFEMFNQLEKAIRDGSPFPFTFSCGYSNDSQGYMPAAACYDNKGYEVAVTHYARGTGEMIVAKEIEMLEALYAGA